ncbi:hypothetical protein IAD21_00723 [Abditibacteriota bacterium]|nr:hypothetical protein IAD21_00723 [Abditibacteriota bacterium]
MSILARRATALDIALLVEMMEEFYNEANYSLDYQWAVRSFTGLFANEANGAVWIVDVASEPAGYIVLTLHFSMEYGGLSASIDDLFVRSACRRLGVGRVALDALLAECRRRHVLAVQVETAPDNVAAKSLYQSCGLELRDDRRETFTLRLGDGIRGTELPQEPPDCAD